jgi:hypothetical protein
VLPDIDRCIAKKAVRMSEFKSRSLTPAKRRRSTTVAPVVEQRTAALEIAEDDVGPWLARNWGILADTPPELLEQIDL